MRKAASSSQGPLLGEDSPPPQGCDHPQCASPGLYRAPKTRQRTNEYYWFCLDHVRDYNRAWNYHEGMDSTEIEAQIREDMVWRRPTWPLGRWGTERQRTARPSFQDGFGFFAQEERRSRAEQQAWRRKPRTEEEKALALLDLAPPVTMDEVKLRYKALAKQLHPDANGGDKVAEERLKLINQAYSTLKASTTFKDDTFRTGV